MAAPCQYTGHTFGHYRIVEPIGAGGMGVVYRAHDERLNRDVALKVLPPNALSVEQTRKRLHKEALILSRLNHPHIASIYDFDTQDGIDFIVMELIHGNTLAKKIALGPMCESDSSYLTLQILDALQEAHSRGIVHRDLKPSNIIVGDNQHLKVLDFGLATITQAIDSSSTESLAQPDQFAGTLSYMAPELLQGHACDVRTDLWSVGILMYEMVSGTRPFIGQTPYEVSSAILRSDPPNLPSDLSETFKAVISRCLLKEPGRRFQTAGEVRAVLGATDFQPHRVKFSRKWLNIAATALLLTAVASIVWLKEHLGSRAPETVLPALKQLAILPLNSTAEAPEMAAFSDGLNETLTTRLTELTRTHDLQIIPTSEIQSRGVKTLQDANEEFGVNLGLELGVQRSGDLLRVNYILVDAKTHRQLRGDTITAAASDPFTLEDKVSTSILGALELELSPEERPSRGSYGTATPAAYDYFLQGRGYLQESQKPENIDSAIAVFGKALGLDPSYVQAFAGLGEAYWQKYELSHEKTYVERATSACKTAVRLENSLPEGYVCLGTVFKGTGQYEMAANAFAKARVLDPTNDDALVGSAAVYQILGRPEQAEDIYRRAIAIRPEYWRNYNLLGGFYASQAQYAKAEDMFEKVVALAPDSFRGYSNLGGIYILEGRYADAVKALDKSAAIRKTAGALSNLGTANFHMRRFEEAAQAYKDAIEFDSSNYALWSNLAAAHYYGGHRTEAEIEYKKSNQLAMQKLDVNPKDASVLADVATNHSMLGNRVEAFSYLNGALQLSPRDPETLFTAAQVYNQFGDQERAIKLVQQALNAGCSPTEIRDAPALDNLRSNAEFRRVFSASTRLDR
jgi:serine/threonine protein kinase/tetratricopeptide (TPR) repeat protein